MKILNLFALKKYNIFLIQPTCVGLMVFA